MSGVNEKEVAVGSVAHILRGVLKEVLPTADTQPTIDSSQEATDSSAPSSVSKSIESPAGRLFPNSIPVEELKEIDKKRREDVELMDRTRDRLETRQRLLQTADQQRFESLRKHHLLLGNELHVDPAHRVFADKDMPMHVPSASATVSFADELDTRMSNTLVIADTLIDAVQRENDIRSGNLHVGEVPADFKRTAGDPHYLVENSATLARKARNEKRFTETVGGFGADFHRKVATHHTSRGLAASSQVELTRPLRKSISFQTAAKSLVGIDTAATGGKGGFSGGDAQTAALEHTEWLDKQFEADMRHELSDDDEHVPTSPRKSTANTAAVPTTDAITALTGTRGEGSLGAIMRSKALTDARRFAGQGVGKGLSMQQLENNAKVAKRMKATQEFLRNPRHSKHHLDTGKLQTDTRIIAGAGRGPSPPRRQLSADNHHHSSHQHYSGHHQHNSHQHHSSSIAGWPTAGVQGDSNTSFGITSHVKLSTAYLPSKGAPAPPEQVKLPGFGLLSEALLGCFLCKPAGLSWREYEAGVRLTGSLLLQNIDSLSRHIRILPPRTRFFSIEEAIFPGNGGTGGAGDAVSFKQVSAAGTPTSLIAPGMHVKVTISFAPTSSAPYDDIISVVTESGTFAVPLEASLPAPELDLSTDVKVTGCFVNDLVTTTLSIRNLGAKAQFRFLPIDAMETYAGAESEEALVLGAFTIFPAHFELKQNENIEITVTFAPDNVGYNQVQFAAVCSNGDVRYHTLGADCPEVRVGLSMFGSVIVDPTAIAYNVNLLKDANSGLPPHPAIVPGGSIDLAALLRDFSGAMVSMSEIADEAALQTQQHSTAYPSLLAFGPHMAYDASTRRIRVRNDTSLTLPCVWRTQAIPTTHSSVTSTTSAGVPTVPPSSITSTTSAGVPVVPPFSITPQECNILPYQDAEFEVLFAPTVVGDYAAVSWIDVAGVPLARSKEDGVVTRGVAQVCALGLSGVCTRIPFQLLPDPHITFPGEIYPGIEAVSTIHIHNPSSIPVAFEFPPFAPCWTRNGVVVSDVDAAERSAFPIVCATPNSGVIEPNSDAVVNVTVSCLRPGAYTSAFSALPSGADATIYLYYNQLPERNYRQAVSPLLSAGSMQPWADSPGRLTSADAASDMPASGGLSELVGFGGNGNNNAAEAAITDATLAGKLSLFVSISVRFPELMFNMPQLDFGLMGTASSVLKRVTLVNRSPCRAPWVVTRVRTTPAATGAALLKNGDENVAENAEIIEQPSDSDFVDSEAYVDNPQACNITIQPCSGVLEAYGTVEIDVSCAAAMRPERLRAALRCLVGAALVDDHSEQIVVLTMDPPPPKLYLPIVGEIQAPKAVLSTSSINYGVTFLGVPVRRPITLQNLSNLPTTFSFDLYINADILSMQAEKPYDAVLRPGVTGALEPKALKTFELVVTPRKLGTVEDALIACDIAGMSYPLGIAVEMEVLGVTVAYALFDNENGMSVETTQKSSPSTATAVVLRAPSPETSSDKQANDAGEDAIDQAPMMAVDDWDDMTADEKFEASLKTIDPGLKADPSVIAMTEAFTFARQQAARVFDIPPIHFKDVPLMKRRTMTLKVFNLSGIPTDAMVSVARFPAWENGATDTDFPSLYAHADGLLEKASRAFTAGSALVQKGASFLGMEEQKDGAAAAHRRRQSSTFRGATAAGSVVHPSPSRSTVITTSTTYRSPSTTRQQQQPTMVLPDANEHANRFSSFAGAERVASHETQKLMRASLGLGHGIAFEIFPTRFNLPPFGYAEVEIAVVADLPGSYEDQLTIRMDGCDDMVVPVSAKVVGKPLKFVSGASGLQMRGALGSVEPTLNFGEHAEGGLPVTKSVTIENTSPRDAHLVWHTMHDRYPHAPAPPATVSILVPQDFNPDQPRVDVFITPQSDRDPADPPPFNVMSPLIVVPAYGKAVIDVSANPVALTESYRSTASKVYGWPEDLLHVWRAVFAADAVWTMPGVKPEENVMMRLHQPLTPRDAEAIAGYDRDAIVLRSVIKPFVPALTVHKRVLADDQPYVKFRVWATAISSGRAMHAGGAVTSNAVRSCTKEVVLTNEMSSDLTFFLAVEGPFSLLNCNTNAPKHPITRLDIITQGDAANTSSNNATLAGKGTAAPALASLFAPGAAPVEELSAAAAEKRIFSLSHRATLTANIMFDAAAGSSLMESAAALFFSKQVKVPPNALSKTAMITAATGETGKFVAESVVETEIAKTVTRLRGEHIGRLVLTFANGHRQYIGLHAEVQKPVILASSSHLHFGTVRTDSQKMLDVFLTNPTEVPAEWQLKHLPAPVSQPSAASQVDWKAYGLSPDNPLWNPKYVQVQPVDDPSVFTFSVSNGTLNGPTVPPEIAADGKLRESPGLAHPLQVSVQFKPRKDVWYQCRFRFSVRAGENFEILLLGKGTYEEM